MGIENYISNMPEKKLNTFKHLITVGILLTIAYAFFSMATLSNPLDFIKTASFLHCALSFIALGFLWKILSGGKIVIPNQSQQQTPKLDKIYQQPKKVALRGSWECSKCKAYVIGEQCPRCGYERR
jgi:hypothetical protein